MDDLSFYSTRIGKPYFAGPHELISLSPSSWAARGWKADEECDSGTAFEDVDLSEGDWADYDERSQEATCISELESQFVKVK